MPIAPRWWMILLALSASSCEGLLDVESRRLVPASELDNPINALVLVQSLIVDFECAYANYVAATALLTDELTTSSGQQGVSIWDFRVVAPSSGGYATGSCSQYVGGTTGTNLAYGVYTPLHVARYDADHALTVLQSSSALAVLTPQKRDSLLALAAAYAGYTYTIFGEGFCTAAFDGGVELLPAAVLARAEERFALALQAAQRATGSDTALNMSRVGRARVRLDLGRPLEAAADARLVDSGFIRHAARQAGLPERENVVQVHNRFRLHVSVDSSFRALRVGGVPDTRVVVTDAGTNGTDGITRVWFQSKYSLPGSPIPIASWDEAQLIIAEAEGGPSAVDRINALRRQARLPTFVSADPDSIRREVAEERRRELFLEGHRLNDMLRFRLPFDGGPGPQGEPFGSTTCLPLPDAERDNNPNLRP